MKKLFITLMAVMAVALFAAPSFAGPNEVQMTLTSPTIYKAGCEKIGSTTYSFSGSSQIAAGDWWYMDLPENITLCKNYNFVIAGVETGTTANRNVYINSAVTSPYTKVGFNAADIGASAAVGAGPLTLGGTTPVLTKSGNMAFLVVGTSGSRRVAIYALTPPSVSSTLSVGADGNMNIKIFDGKAWNLTATTADNTRILLDVDGDGVYGEANYLGGSSTTDEVIGGDETTAATSGEPYVENTLCANAEQLSGQYVYTSYASKSDKFTFSGDSQIAHTAATGAISLTSCKGETQFDIEMDSSQSASACWFEYEVAVGSNGNFCSTDWPTAGQRFLIEASSGAFGDIGDKYSVDAEITSPSDGVYFAGTPTVTLYKSSEDECTATGTASGAAFTAYESGASTAATGYAPTNCTVNTGYRVVKVVGTSASVFELDNYDTVFVDFAKFAFGNTMVAAGEEVTVQVTLNRYPCGTIFTGTRTIGTFVTSCTSASSTTLRFPWLPGTAATGWWGGYVITNFGTTAGTAVLTYRDSDGATATYTTPSVAAGAQFTSTAVTAADLTDVDGYDASKNFSINAACAFTARGFAFTGNGTEGTGYVVDN
jgi:hypothetical protein